MIQGRRSWGGPFAPTDAGVHHFRDGLLAHFYTPRFFTNRNRNKKLEQFRFIPSLA